MPNVVVERLCRSPSRTSARFATALDSDHPEAATPGWFRWHGIGTHSADDQGAIVVTGMPDGPAQWRAEIIDEFRLRSEERCAAASPDHGFPQLLVTTVDALDHSPPGPWVDVGGGLGGLASWLERRTGRTVIAIDRSIATVRSARRLFRDLPLAVGDAAKLPIASQAASAVLISGLWSSIQNPAPVVNETMRVLMPGGVLAIADLWSASSEAHRTEAGCFRSIESVRDQCESLGLRLSSVGICEPGVGWWPSAADQVDDQMRHRFGHRPEWQSYDERRALLRDEVDSGRLLAAVVALGQADRS